MHGHTIVEKQYSDRGKQTPTISGTVKVCFLSCDISVELATIRWYRIVQSKHS